MVPLYQTASFKIRPEARERCERAIRQARARWSAAQENHGRLAVVLDETKSSDASDF